MKWQIKTEKQRRNKMAIQKMFKSNRSQSKKTVRKQLLKTVLEE